MSQSGTVEVKVSGKRVRAAWVALDDGTVCIGGAPTWRAAVALGEALVRGGVARLGATRGEA